MKEENISITAKPPYPLGTFNMRATVTAPEPIGRWKFHGLEWPQFKKHPNLFHKFMVKIFFGMTYEK